MNTCTCTHTLLHSGNCISCPYSYPRPAPSLWLDQNSTHLPFTLIMISLPTESFPQHSHQLRFFPSSKAKPNHHNKNLPVTPSHSLPYPIPFPWTTNWLSSTGLMEQSSASICGIQDLISFEDGPSTGWCVEQKFWGLWSWLKTDNRTHRDQAFRQQWTPLRSAHTELVQPIAHWTKKCWPTVLLLHTED